MLIGLDFSVSFVCDLRLDLRGPDHYSSNLSSFPLGCWGMSDSGDRFLVQRETFFYLFLFFLSSSSSSSLLELDSAGLGFCAP